MSTTEEEVEITSLFGGSVSRDERGLAIHEGVPGSSAVPDLQFAPIWIWSSGRERSA